MSPALAAQYAAWARSVCASGTEAASYREPALSGARAPSAAEAAARELEDAAAVLSKAVLREGEANGGCPAAGNEVVVHVTLRLADDPAERLLSTTDEAEGGRGVPLLTQLGDSCTLLRGAELALAAFRRGESAVLRLPPEFAWAHPTAAARGLVPPRGVSRCAPLLCVLTLLDFYPVRLLADAAAPSGLVSKRILAEGRGLETPHAPYEVEVTVSVTLPGSQPHPPRTLRFSLGAGAVPPALDTAVASMRPGERASAWCAPACALRPAALLPELPEAAPDGVLYALELLGFTQVRDLYGDGSLRKRRLSPGEGDFPVDCPVHDCLVTVALRAWALLPGGERRELERRSEEQPLRIELGTGELPPGLEAAVRLMLPGERAVVRARPRHGYDGLPRGRWARPAALPAAFEGDTEWEVLLVAFDKPLNWHAATPAECLEAAAAAKASGVALYKSGCWALARTRFEALAFRLNGLRGLEEADEEAANALRASCLLNAAAASQQLGEHVAAAAHASAVLERLDPDSGRALFRRAVSRTALGDWAGAADDLAAARALVDSALPESCEELAALDRQTAKLRAAQRAAASETRSQLRGFLDKP